jgi:uncharacterized small protein (DUF1192 family)
MSDHPIRDDRNLATLEKAIGYITTLESELAVAQAEIERLTRERNKALDSMADRAAEIERLNFVTILNYLTGSRRISTTERTLTG